MAMPIPSLLLKQLYTFGSLKNGDQGVRFSLKNRLSDATITKLSGVSFDDRRVPIESITIELGEGTILQPQDIVQNPVDFPLRSIVDIVCDIDPLPDGKHAIEVHFTTKPFGKLKLKVDGSIVSELAEQPIKIPRNNTDDYADEIIQERQRFIEEYSGRKLEHINHYSFDPHIAAGNIENFAGVAQVPIGFAGPLTIHGEHVDGEVIVPMATAEGTLVASYNRGMKIINLSGGVTCSVVGDSMQRAPVFVFSNAARGAGLCQMGGSEYRCHCRAGRGHVKRGQASIH